MNIQTTLLDTSLVSTGLVSGLLYGWAVSVIPGTRRVPAGTYVDTMQHINRAILDPAFLVPFMGIPVVLGAAAYSQFRVGDHRRGWLLASATATYVVGVLGVTIGRTVPLSDALDRFHLAAAVSEAVDGRRASYETPWNRWHHVRTLAGVAAFSLTAAAAVPGEATSGDGWSYGSMPVTRCR